MNRREYKNTAKLTISSHLTVSISHARLVQEVGTMFISPMLLQKVEEPFNNDDWLSELKLDGIRLLYSTIKGFNFYTRHENEVTERFPELISNKIPEGIILDGEIILTDSEGKPDFEELMCRFLTKNLNRIKRLSQCSPITYCVFDVVYYKGKRITHLPLVERKEILNKILPNDLPQIIKTLSISGMGEDLFQSVRQQDLEGVVLKKKDSQYEIGKRSNNWLKVINYKYITVSIAGYRKSEFGWLLEFMDGKPAGLMELGVSAEACKMVYELAHKVKAKETKDYVHFPNNSLTCKVKYRTLTKTGLLRLPSFLEFATG
jgi:DNA ligase-1